MTEVAYNTKELKERILKLIEKENLLTLEEVYTFAKISSSTLYDHFPKDSKDSKDIKEALRNNKTRVKHSQKAKWYKSDNATLQIALFKLCSTEEERKRLTSSYTEVSGKLDTKITGLEDIAESLQRIYEQEDPSDSETNK